MKPWIGKNLSISFSTIESYTCNTNKTCCPGGPDDACCTDAIPCSLGEGGCDGDNSCEGDLLCGNENCDVALGFTTCKIFFSDVVKHNGGIWNFYPPDYVKHFHIILILAHNCCMQQTHKCRGKFATDECCSETNKCEVGEGHCADDSACGSGLKCGIQNCDYSLGFNHGYNCCYKE